MLWKSPFHLVWLASEVLLDLYLKTSSAKSRICVLGSCSFIKKNRSFWSACMTWHKPQKLEALFSQWWCSPLDTKLFTVSPSASAQSLRRVRLFAAPWAAARPPCPSPTSRVYSNSCPLSRWRHQPSHPLLTPSDSLYSYGWRAVEGGVIPYLGILKRFVEIDIPPSVHTHTHTHTGTHTHTNAEIFISVILPVKCIFPSCFNSFRK